ncbi:hypothetical protein AK812_SmicGene44293 [Symbiodinium microadriaticum]|uniref:Uncharacterized protein n=1 Tax=Symbiodinium microadriaticum TaxID=2951 RepID=A0A1Q9BYX2_SYMMI|nr:hypothetical protein AK812_SmicGene44293 [Symbiodinium microadriaticum]CAE7869934.1 unnamed protein product [Symbiodinium sp. KB8]
MASPAAGVADGEQCSGHVAAAHARHAWLSLAKSTASLRLPWDTVPWEVSKRARMTLLPSGIMPPVPVETRSYPSLRSEQNLTDVASDCFRRAGIRPLKARDEAIRLRDASYDRQCAVKKWVTLIAVEPAAWEIAKQTYGKYELRFATGGIVESVSDALAGKANSTLHGRAGPLLRYAKFWGDMGKTCFPVHEAQLYDFLKSLEDCAPGFPRSLLLAISFAFHLLGLEVRGAALLSGRIKGVVQSHYVRRRKAIVHNAKRSKYDRVAAGFFLLLVYGRLRFSDGQRITSMSLDVVQVHGRQSGFLECEAERTKTALTLEKKVRRLPVAVPLQCLGPPWIPVWLKLRKSEGLAADGDKDIQEPILRHPACGSGWTAAMVTVGYAASWLRTLLDAAPSGDSVPIGTHSCKATLLSWAAKRGLAHGPRRLLGYHVASKDSTMVIYSRDALADPLRQLVSLVQEVSDGKFQPDLTRSGMMLAQTTNNEAPRSQCQADAEVQPDSSSESSMDEEDGNPTDDEAAVDEVVGAWAPIDAADDDRQYVRHKTSRFLDLIKDEAGAELMCGRKLSVNYRKLPRKPKFVYPACSVCLPA